MTTAFARLAAALAFVGATSAAGAAQAPPPGTPLTLAQALAYAVEHYPSVKAALETMQASAATVSAARTTAYPRLDALWQVNRATANNVFGQVLPQSVLPSMSGPALPDSSGTSAWGSAIGALVSWEPVDFGLRGATVHEAEAGLVRARADEALTSLAVQNAVANAFFSLAAAKQSVAAADADVERRDVLARVAHALADNQLRPGAEASRADAELAAARTRAIQANRARAVAAATLAQMLGSSEASIDVDVAGLALPALPDAASTPAATPGATAHPLVQAGQASVDLAAAKEAVLARSNLPRLLLQTSVFARGTGANPDGTFDGGASGLGFDRANWAAGFQVVVPNVFDFAGLHARRAAAAAATRAETARHDEAVLTVTAQQRVAAADVEAARAIAANTPVQLAAARQSEAQARARYDAGLAGLTDVADAQNLLANAEYQDAVARLDVWRALLAQAVAAGDLSPYLALLNPAGGR